MTNTAVIAPGTPPKELPQVVVGLDGSEASQRALLFAANEARLRDAVLHVVAAYEVGTAGYGYGYAGGLGMAVGMDGAALQDQLRLAAEELVKAAGDTVATLTSGTPVHLRTTVAQGHASQVLLDAAQGATLLVVGARGAGALTRLLLGSTSTAVVHHARLPVTVVPTGEDEPCPS